MQVLIHILKIPYQLFHVITAFLVIGGTFFFVRYKAAIERRKENVKAKLARGLVYRDKISKASRMIKVLELHPSFKNAHDSSWQMCSLGEYLSTLRFFTDSKDDDDDDDNDRNNIVEKELYVVMSSLLMRAFGDTVGSALLPVLGMKPAETLLETISSKIVSYMVSKFLVDSCTNNEDWDPTHDLAALPLNVSELMSFVNLNQKLTMTTAGNKMETSPMRWMKRGEIGYDPTYDDDDDDDKDNNDSRLVPNPFIIEEHFHTAILALEERIRSSQKGTATTYDPNDRSCPEPTPINRIILPDLYLGWGDAKVTHTQQERLRNRLFAVLLTKLSYNYELMTRDDDDDEDYFIVQMKGIDCTLPDEFLQVLCDSGHTIEVCPRSLITTFGMAACIKEDDGSWTNIPIAFFFQTGYESQRQRPAYYHALHGGIDLNIQGPLVGINPSTGQSNKCDLQFYMAIDGMCAWHSNHNMEVPWIQPVSTTNIYNQEQALMAIRMSGIVACTFNQIGTEMDLPFGGYGVLGVCNDTAAIVDFAVRGQTNMYPLLSTGRFLMHITKFLTRFHDRLNNNNNNNRKRRNNQKNIKASIADTLRLASAACNMQSDIHCSPTQMIGAAKRYSSNYPTAYFQIGQDSKEVMEEIRKQYEDLESKLS